jgi:hypothetical protein
MVQVRDSFAFKIRKSSESEIQKFFGTGTGTGTDPIPKMVFEMPKYKK